jgi:FkbM family methyltransferase
MSATLVQWVDRQRWFHAVARILRLRTLASWFLRLRPLSRSYPSGAIVEVADLESIFLRDEIFRRETYRHALTRAGEVRTVVDLGCNVGFFCCYLRHYFGRSDFRGFGIDANVAVLERAERHLQLNGLDRMELFHGLVGSTDNALVHDFYVYASHLDSSQFVQLETGRESKGAWTKREVPVLVPGELWRDGYGDETIDLLKIDIEGSEGKLLQTDPALFWQTKCIVLQWHKGLVKEEEIFPALRDFGFTHYERLEATPRAELWFFSREAWGTSVR